MVPDEIAGYEVVTLASGAMRITVDAPDGDSDSADSELVRIRAALPVGWTADWSGEGHTDADGHSTEDVTLTTPQGGTPGGAGVAPAGTMTCDGCGAERDAACLSYEDCGSPADGASGTTCTDHEGVRALCDECWDGRRGSAQAPCLKDAP